MSDLTRFGASLEKALLRRYDRAIREEGYSNRSEALRDLIRGYLVRKEWKGGKEVAGAITLVYDHHKRELLNTLVDIQHHCHHLIISTQHIHLDHSNCLEIIAVRGSPREIDRLAGKLKAARGVKHGDLTMATTGKEL